MKSISQSVVSVVGWLINPSCWHGVNLSSGPSVNPYVSLSVQHCGSPSAVINLVCQSLGQLANQIVDQSIIWVSRPLSSQLVS